jgi:hypothetical protein
MLSLVGSLVLLGGFGVKDILSAAVPAKAASGGAAPAGTAPAVTAPAARTQELSSAR